MEPNCWCSNIHFATVTEAAQLLEISRDTVYKVITAYEKEGKTSSAKHKLGRSS